MSALGEPPSPEASPHAGGPRWGPLGCARRHEALRQAAARRVKLESQRSPCGALKPSAARQAGVRQVQLAPNRRRPGEPRRLSLGITLQDLPLAHDSRGSSAAAGKRPLGCGR